MDETKTYIVEIPQVLGDDSTIYLEADGEVISSFFAVLEVSAGGASIVDNCYRSISEAQEAWPHAIAPRPVHLTPKAIDRNFTIEGRNSRGHDLTSPR